MFGASPCAGYASDRASIMAWTRQLALPQAEERRRVGEGVVVILENRDDEPIEEQFSQYVGDTLPKPGMRLVLSTVGTGSQILKHANVGKMRLLSTPMKFSAISGFDLEVVEYVEYEG